MGPFEAIAAVAVAVGKVADAARAAMELLATERGGKWWDMQMSAESEFRANAKEFGKFLLELFSVGDK